jgi:CHAT domain-containing protein
MLRANSRHTSVTRLSRDAATHERVLSELEQGDYDLLHFGGHAWFDSREAYFMLWDRIMLGSELAPLLGRRPPALMVLNTHFTAFVLAEEDAMVRDLVASPACVAPPRPARNQSPPAAQQSPAAPSSLFKSVT